LLLDIPRFTFGDHRQGIFDDGTQRIAILFVNPRMRCKVDHQKAVLDELGSAFEVVPLDVFLKMAATDPTFETYTRPE